MEPALLAQYRDCYRRLFLLDYDGTLAAFRTDPSQAVLTPTTKTVLRMLGGKRRNSVVIVSGRDHHTLGQWLGDLPLNLVAEYGHFARAAGQPWVGQPAGRQLGWQPVILPMLEATAATLPGSFVEQKTFSLVWHYRAAAPGPASRARATLLHQLMPLVKQLDLELAPGHQVIEVRQPGTDKATVARSWLRQPWDFLLAAGDDVADEALFRTMPGGAFIIKVGPGRTAARYRLADPPALTRLLGVLAKQPT